MTTIRPSTTATPAGVCIHEFATMIQNADSDEPSATMPVANRCTPRGTRSQPNIMMPMKPASSMNAMAPSKPRILPKNWPVNCENALQLVPNSNSIGMPLTTPTAKFSSSSLPQKRAWRYHVTSLVRTQSTSTMNRNADRLMVRIGQRM